MNLILDVYILRQHDLLECWAFTIR